MRFFVVLADDGEGVEDVSGIVAGQAVEVEEQCIEPSQRVTAVVLVPRKGRAVITQVAPQFASSDYAALMYFALAALATLACSGSYALPDQSI